LSGVVGALAGFGYVFIREMNSDNLACDVAAQLRVQLFLMKLLPIVILWG
jgi:hypothetical protein